MMMIQTVEAGILKFLEFRVHRYYCLPLLVDYQQEGLYYWLEQATTCYWWWAHYFVSFLHVDVAVPNVHEIVPTNSTVTIEQAKP